VEAPFTTDTWATCGDVRCSVDPNIPPGCEKHNSRHKRTQNKENLKDMKIKLSKSMAILDFL
jgi:hypothetical protein